MMDQTILHRTSIVTFRKCLFVGLAANSHRDQSNIFLRGNELLTVTGKHEETSAHRRRV